MKMVRIPIQLPLDLKSKLDAERSRGTSTAGLIRYLLEQHFQQTEMERRLLEPTEEISS